MTHFTSRNSTSHPLVHLVILRRSESKPVLCHCICSALSSPERQQHVSLILRGDTSGLFPLHFSKGKADGPSLVSTHLISGMQWDIYFRILFLLTSHCHHWKGFPSPPESFLYWLYMGETFQHTGGYQIWLGSPPQIPQSKGLASSKYHDQVF